MSFLFLKIGQYMLKKIIACLRNVWLLHPAHDRRHSFVWESKLVWLSFVWRQTFFLDLKLFFRRWNFSSKVGNDEKWEFANFIDVSLKENVWFELTVGRDWRNVFWRSSAKRREPAQQKSLVLVYGGGTVIYFSPSLCNGRPYIHTSLICILHWGFIFCLKFL